MTTVSTHLAAVHLAATHLADGPAMYFGGTIMTFALPMGAFIVATIALFYLFRANHTGPKLKYLTTAPFASFGTREPGPVPAPPAANVTTETAGAGETTGGPETTTDPEAPGATSEPED
jgi:hypothetical protein